MAHWEIRLINQQPVRVVVAADRNLCTEYQEFEELHQDVRWWKFWQTTPSPYWQVTESVVLHKDVVVGVVPKPPKPARRRIGF